MARVHNVKRAQKDQGSCAAGDGPIKKGDPYSWVKANRFAMKYKRHPGCLPFPMMEMEGNEKKAMCYQAQADLQSAIQAAGKFEKDDKRSDEEKVAEFLEDLETAFDEAIGQVDEAIGEWETAYDNLPEGFQQGDSGQQMEELKDQAESYRDELDSVKDSFDEYDVEEDKLADYLERIREEADQAAGALEF
jgi:tetratricopeptide (TPR) repeat protein